MITNFCEQLSTDFDLEIAVFIENLIYWLKLNAAKDKPELRNFHDGHYWSYNSYPELAKLFPCWSAKSIRTIISRAVKSGLIIIGSFNRKKYDNTNWYTISDKVFEYYPHVCTKLRPVSSVDSDTPDTDLNTPAQTGRRPAQTGRPIPKELNSLGSNINITTTSKQQLNQLMRELIGIYRNVFPNNPQPHPKVISTTLQKTLQTLIKRWPEVEPDGKPIEVSTFRRYLELLRDNAPKFSLGEYTTQDGRKKKNNMETFCRWNTLVNFLENQYS